MYINYFYLPNFSDQQVGSEVETEVVLVDVLE